MGDAIDSEHLSEMTEDDETYVIKSHMTGFTKLDARYLIPFFTKRFTQKEMREGRSQVDMLATQWQKEVRAAPSESEDDNENTEIETCLITTASTASLFQNSTLPPNDKV
ncbi:unnamed protein product [Candidula unifasciata]|uniref:Uncharacterized protein n=1 Tax=Candidula unifasciata TaxID=100452 RepID=A0A8S3ZTM8_9EUPU|nr:unnamed protein product [Candidula unifasciata]